MVTYMFQKIWGGREEAYFLTFYYFKLKQQKEVNS